LAVLPANAQSPNMLCEFVKIVLSAKPDGFDLLKGEAQNPAVFHNEVFHGAVLPNQSRRPARCSRNAGGARDAAAAAYSCTIAQSDDFARCEPDLSTRRNRI